MEVVCNLCEQNETVNKIGVCNNCMDYTEPIVRQVTFIHLPDTEDGRLGFKYRKSDPVCVLPNRGYRGPNSDKIIGRCHIYDIDEWTELVTAYSTDENKIYTHNEFEDLHPRKYWLDDYSRYISKELGRILEEGGIQWVVTSDPTSKDTKKKNLVHFKCKKGDFVKWDR